MQLRLLKLALLRNTVGVPVQIYLLLAFPVLSLSTIWWLRFPYATVVLETGTSGGEAAGGRRSVVGGIEVKMPGREVP